MYHLERLFHRLYNLRLCLPSSTESKNQVIFEYFFFDISNRRDKRCGSCIAQRANGRHPPQPHNQQSPIDGVEAFFRDVDALQRVDRILGLSSLASIPPPNPKLVGTSSETFVPGKFYLHSWLFSMSWLWSEWAKKSSFQLTILSSPSWIGPVESRYVHFFSFILFFIRVTMVWCGVHCLSLTTRLHTRILSITPYWLQVTLWLTYWYSHPLWAQSTARKGSIRARIAFGES